MGKRSRLFGPGIPRSRTRAHSPSVPPLSALDGLIVADYFNGKAAEWRAEQQRVERHIDQHEVVNQNYLDEGVSLLELAQRAYILYESQEPREQRRLLNFVCLNASRKGGKPTATYRQPFDLLARSVAAARHEQAASSAQEGRFDGWLGN